MKFAPLSLLILALSSTVANAQSDACVPCEGEVDSSLSFDGIPCTNWLAVAGSAPTDSAQCAFDRMVGVWFCGCPVPEEVEETCTLCENGSTAYNADKLFPDSVITCSDISSVKALDGERTCNELSQMGDYCECPISAEKCDICPNGGSPSKLDNVFLTTGETCQYAMEVLQASPASNCNMYLPDMMVDIPSFCGCPGSAAPKTCSLCPAGSKVVDPLKPIQYVPGSTCADFEAYTEYVTEDQLCDYIQEVIADECCEGFAPVPEDSFFECNFCPDGNNIAVPDRELLGVNITCSDLANRKRDDNTTDCPAIYETELDMLIDTGIYCGCPEIDSTGVCAFCPLGLELLHPERAITDGVDIEGATCAQYAALADSTFDDDFCSAVRGIGELNECCGVPKPSNSTAATDKTESTSSTGFCNLCGADSNVQDKEKVFLGTSVTCQTYHDELGAIPQGDECDAIVAEFTSTFDPTIYCNCPGTEPTGKCNLCPEGYEVVDPTIWISDIFTTCGQMDDIAKATMNQDFCSSLQRVGEYYCCYSPETNGDKRNLRTNSDTPSKELTPFHHRPYHFAALKAIANVQDAVSNLVGKQASFDLNSEKR